MFACAALTGRPAGMKKARVSLGLLTVAHTSQVTLEGLARAKVQPFKLTTKKNVKRIKITERKNNMIFLIDPLQDMKILIIFVVSK